MNNRLYKVKIETDIMVVSDSESSAIEIAKKNASGEVGVYGRGSACAVRSLSDIPNDWKSVIPYGKEGTNETRKCFEIAGGLENKHELPQEDIEEIIKIKGESKTPSVGKPFMEIKPETRPDPKPKELDWHETKSGRPMPALRFVK